MELKTNPYNRGIRGMPGQPDPPAIVLWTLLERGFLQEVIFQQDLED